MTQLLQEFESADFFRRWIDAMNDNCTLCILDADKLSDAPPEELKLYHHLDI